MGLELLSPRNARGTFFRRLEEATAATWVGQVSNMFPSDQDMESYPFLDDVPPMSKSVGPTKAATLGSNKIEVVNEDHDLAITLPLKWMRRDKTPQTQTRIRELAGRVAQYPTKLVADAILANANSYDGQAFFSDHSGEGFPIIDNAQTSNIGTPAAPTSAEHVASILQVLQTLYGSLDSQGEPNGHMGRQFHMVVPVNHMSATVAALNDLFTTAGTSNTLKSLTGSQPIQISYSIEPRLGTTAGTKWWMFRTDADVKAAIVQEEFAEFAQLGPGSEYSTMNQLAWFGAFWSGNAKLARYDVACQMTYT